MIIWSALCPLAALLLDDLRGTIGWIAGFVALLALSVVLQPYLTPAPLSETFIIVFFALNLGTVIAIAFVLLYHFVGSGTSSRSARRCCSSTSCRRRSPRR